jgi:hypothetical protein
MFEKRRLKRKGTKGKGIVTAAKTIRSPDGTRPTGYDITVKMKFEDGSEYENSSTIGGGLSATTLSFGSGDVVPVLYDPDDRSNFIVDEGLMEEEQKARLERGWQGEEEWAEERVEEAEQNLPPNP